MKNKILGGILIAAVLLFIFAPVIAWQINY